MTNGSSVILLTEYNQDEFHLLHAQTVENTMRYFARELGFADEEDFWGIVGLLHDLGFEKYPEEHCIKSQEIMKERGIDEKIIHATASHGYAITVDIKPEHEMEKVLYAVDELSCCIDASVKKCTGSDIKVCKEKIQEQEFRSRMFQRSHRTRSGYAWMDTGRSDSENN